ncbi:hypothetical protein BS47DRAFT_540743 [Hydnum rufescens UP504]|uniref:Uncharacterized protein n=1 Tax=Hydnum rufescens UP504 TaxID=1448309 RepID=A0A9P6B583_9AGAM|nr:hypothetical protein BS47DRAFT_540743 [Hydnum rufescens UP504]
MFFNLLTLVLPFIFLGGITTATPLETRAGGVAKVPGVNVSKLEIPVPKSPTIAPDSEHIDLAKVAPHPSELTTSPNSAFHTLAATAVDQFVICTSRHCRNCIGYKLSSIRRDVCYHTESFLSFYIYRPSGRGLPYPFFVGLSRCSSPNYIPRVNECYYSPGPNGSARHLTTFYHK